MPTKTYLRTDQYVELQAWLSKNAQRIHDADLGVAQTATIASRECGFKVTRTHLRKAWRREFGRTAWPSRNGKVSYGLKEFDPNTASISGNFGRSELSVSDTSPLGKAIRDIVESAIEDRIDSLSDEIIRRADELERKIAAEAKRAAWAALEEFAS